MARTQVAHSSCLARIILMVPNGHFMLNPHWNKLARTNFHGPKNSK